ncbi:MAG TPA: hypothetical protein VHV57_16735 [Acidimicrobiales bacterium]|nr:hypothetical protein [Acidimicrobiales bacterium]
MSKHGVRVGAVAMTTATLLSVGAATASGATPTNSPASLSTIQTRAAAAITARVNDLNAASAKINGAKDLGSGTSALLAYVQNDIAPLQQLGQKIAGDTTVAEAKADTATIFTNYRVLVLVRPAARLAARADGATNALLPALTADAAKATAHVTPANQATLQPLIADLNTQISSATTDTTGVATTVLSYSPAGWNANHELLSASRNSMSAARSAVAKARSDLQQIRSALRG